MSYWDFLGQNPRFLHFAADPLFNDTTEAAAIGGHSFNQAVHHRSARGPPLNQTCVADTSDRGS